MTASPAARGIAGAAVVAIAAAGTLLFGGTPETALVTIVGGTAAVLLVLALGEPLAPTAAPDRLGPDAAGHDAAIGAVLDVIVQPVLILDDRRITLANRAARALLGQHIVGEEALTAIRHPAAARHLADPGADRTGVDLTGLGTRDQRWRMHVEGVPGGRRVVHLIDQTGYHQTEQIRTDFVANASHELRTPLAAILGFIETLEDPAAGSDADTRKRFLKVMFDEARRMQRLVDDLMSLSRIEAEKHRAPDSAVDLPDLARQVVDEMRATHPVRGADIALDVADGLPAVAGDRIQLSQLLHNLIGNAMKYGRAGTPVTLAIARESEGLLVLRVTDRGDGIAADHLPRLTERFYRVDAGRSRMLGGTGLGLAIVKHIVERHRGRLDIASTVGVGTTVSVRLRARREPLSSNGHPAVTQDARPR